jgi:hypothetical protein
MRERSKASKYCSSHQEFFKEKPFVASNDDQEKFVPTNIIYGCGTHDPPHYWNVSWNEIAVPQKNSFVKSRRFHN